MNNDTNDTLPSDPVLPEASTMGIPSSLAPAEREVVAALVSAIDRHTDAVNRMADAFAKLAEAVAHHVDMTHHAVR